ncbi:MAG: twin-arginine translocase subunit TatC [Acidobacteria bacterium]|nr:twin-arginine translocase subunit TatC [Acidobacteriota bacterium]
MSSAEPDLAGRGEEGSEEGLPRMTLLDHLDELRRRLLYSVIALFVAFLGSWYFAPNIFHWLERPILDVLPEGEQLAFIELSGPFMLYVKVALLTAVFVASPFLLLQLWLFLRPGLYRRERRLAVPFVIFTTLFFVAGGYFGYLVAFPMVVRFLLGVGEDFKQVVTIGTYFAMMSKILLGLGLVFEMPMLIFFFARIGLVSARQLLRWFRWAVLLIFVTAAIITPTPDVATQTVFAVPMILLYLLGVGVAAIFGTKKDADDD